MASEGPNSPGTMADDATVGDRAWSSPDNAKVSDDTYTFVGTLFGADQPAIEETIKIVKADSSLSATNKSTGATIPTTEAYISYGNATELWGESWTPANINSSNFGVVFNCSVTGGEANWLSHYLKATNFNFSIPVDATIDGIQVDIEQKKTTVSGRTRANVDHIRITVTYTEASVGTNTQINIGDAWKEIAGIQINIGDTWKAVEGMQINIGDTWKTIF